MKKGKSVVHAEITCFTENGIPYKGIVTYADASSGINEGEVIEFVGYIIQLLNLLDVIFRKIKSWFGKTSPALVTVILFFALILLPNCTLNRAENARKLSMGKEMYRQARSFERSFKIYLSELTYCRNWKIQLENDRLSLYVDHYSPITERWRSNYKMTTALTLKALKAYVAEEYCHDDACYNTFFTKNHNQ
jgi:hypothetical protein